jgi:hypothetical protein
VCVCVCVIVKAVAADRFFKCQPCDNDHYRDYKRIITQLILCLLNHPQTCTSEL